MKFILVLDFQFLKEINSPLTTLQFIYDKIKESLFLHLIYLFLVNKFKKKLKLIIFK